MSDSQNLPINQLKLISLLELCKKEAEHLIFSWQRIFPQKNNPSPEWITSLKDNEEDAAHLEAFSSRFSRLQDSLGSKLLPALLTCLAETPSSQIENLNKAEKLGIISSTQEWLNVREMRNQLVHEYLEDTNKMLEALIAANRFTPVLIETFNKIRLKAIQTLSIEADVLPSSIK